MQPKKTLETLEDKKVKHNEVKQILERKLIPLVPAWHREDADIELKHIHEGKDGFITIATKPGFQKYSQWHLPYEELTPKVQNFMDVENVYISMNGFWTAKRRLTTIRHLNCFWVDLDYYNVPRLKKKNTEEMICYLRKKKLFDNTGEPSFFVDSGNGMYIVWIIKDCSKQMLPFWQTIQNKLHSLFEPHGADPKSKDCTHILRLAGTTNGKTGRRARFLYNSSKEFRFEQEREEMRVYTIQELADKLLDKLEYTKEEWLKRKAENRKNKKEKEKEKEKAKNKVKSLFNLHTLHYKRMEDIVQLIELRKGNVGSCRELMCFLYRYYSCCFLRDEELALQNTLEINSMFAEPLTINEVVNSTRSAEDAFKRWEDTFNEYMELEKKPNIIQYFCNKKCYIYSNNKLIELLKITQEEMTDLSTIINTKEKNERSKEYRNEWNKKNFKKQRRNENGLTAREQAKFDKMVQIEELLVQGIKKTEIAEKLSISRQMVYKYIDEINNRKDESVHTNSEKIIEIYESVDITDVEAIIC
jgi:hypothetical protein